MTITIMITTFFIC